MSATSSLTGTLKGGEVKWEMKGHSIMVKYQCNGMNITDVISLIPGPDGQYAIIWRGSDGDADAFMVNKTEDKYKVWDEMCITLIEGGDLEDVVKRRTTPYKF